MATRKPKPKLNEEGVELETEVETPAEVEGEGQDLSYPPPANKDPNTKSLLRNWKIERRIKCAHKACYYPLNPIRDPQTKELKMLTAEQTAENEPAIEAVCSWDRRHMLTDGSPQYILVSALKPPEEDDDA